MTTYLRNLSTRLDWQFISDNDAFAGLQLLPDIAALNWPAEVVRQWLWEHGMNDSFLRDYAALDLCLLCEPFRKVNVRHRAAFGPVVFGELRERTPESVASEHQRYTPPE